LYYDAETTTAAAAAAGDVNWMKYSEVACDEARAELGRTGKTFGCRFVVQQIHWPIARSGLDCGGAGGRSSAVKHDELTFIFIKRCLSPAAAAILGALAGRREQYAAGQWKAMARSAAKRSLLSRHLTDQRAMQDTLLRRTKKLMQSRQTSCCSYDALFCF